VKYVDRLQGRITKKEKKEYHYRLKTAYLLIIKLL